MASYFPIFVDVQSVPPLVIGDRDVLASKIRLLAKMAPIIDVVSSTPSLATSSAASSATSSVKTLANPDHISDHISAQINVRAGVTAHDDAVLLMLAGRPLVIIETGDPARNKVLAQHARSLGVPVNVPDTISLCSFFLGSIVDRSPVIVAISTSGLAPVLAQHIRAQIEDMLAPATGRLAHYLFRLRDRIKHFPHAMRRGLQHQILKGQIAQYVLAGKEVVADNAIMHMLGNVSPSQDPSQDQTHTERARIQIVDAGAGAKGLLSLDAAEAIRHADSIFYDHLVSDEVLDLARREAKLTFCQIVHNPQAQPKGGLHKANMSMASLLGKLKTASKTNDRIIYLAGGDPRQTRTADFMLKALGDHGLAGQHITSAATPRVPSYAAPRPAINASEIVQLGVINNRNNDLREGA